MFFTVVNVSVTENVYIGLMTGVRLVGASYIFWLWTIGSTMQFRTTSSAKMFLFYPCNIGHFSWLKSKKSYDG
jgi:hypothetical protein